MCFIYFYFILSLCGGAFRFEVTSPMSPSLPPPRPPAPAAPDADTAPAATPAPPPPPCARTATPRIPAYHHRCRRSQRGGATPPPLHHHHPRRRPASARAARCGGDVCFHMYVNPMNHSNIIGKGCMCGNAPPRLRAVDQVERQPALPPQRPPDVQQLCCVPRVYRHQHVRLTSRVVEMVAMLPTVTPP